MNNTPDPAYTFFIITMTLLLVFLAGAMFSRWISERAKRDGIEIGIIIGEANELRRRDDMNLRARAKADAELQVIREAIERDEWDKEIDADKGVM